MNSQWQRLQLSLGLSVRHFYVIFISLVCRWILCHFQRQEDQHNEPKSSDPFTSAKGFYLHHEGSCQCTLDRLSSKRKQTTLFSQHISTMLDVISCIHYWVLEKPEQTPTHGNKILSVAPLRPMIFLCCCTAGLCVPFPSGRASSPAYTVELFNGWKLVCRAASADF